MKLNIKELQKEVIQNKVKHGFNITDIKFKLLLLYGEVMNCFKLGLKMMEKI